MSDCTSWWCIRSRLQSVINQFVELKNIKNKTCWSISITLENMSRLFWMQLSFGSNYHVTIQLYLIIYSRPDIFCSFVHNAQWCKWVKSFRKLQILKCLTQLDSAGVNWTQLNSIELNRTHLESTGLNQTQLDSIRLNWTQPDLTGLNRTQPDSTRLKWTQSDWNGLNQTQQTQADSTGLSRTQQNSIWLNRTNLIFG